MPSLTELFSAMLAGMIIGYLMGRQASSPSDAHEPVFVCSKCDTPRMLVPVFIDGVYRKYSLWLCPNGCDQKGTSK